MAASETRSELQKTFQGRPAAQHISGWDDLWKKSLTPWDRAGPSQALRDAILSQNQHLFGSPIKKLAKTTTMTTGPQQQQQQRKKALVPGCGRGYDVLSLASLGYDTFGLDGSENAILAARKLEAEEISCGSDAYRLRDPLVGKGKVQFIVGDFFHEDFLTAITTNTTTHGDSNDTVPPTTEEKFDLIFDYTFLCALPRELRPTWAKRMSELLAPDGFLVCLEWPLQKSPKEGGPPHGLSAELYEELLRKPGQEVEYDDDDDDDGEGYVVVSAGDSTTRGGGGGGDDGRAKNALVRLERYRPSRTHEAGKDSDYISIWKRTGN